MSDFQAPPQVPRRFQTDAAENAAQSVALTRLIDKHYSPLVVRKTSKWGFPVWVTLITDDDLSNLDDVIETFMDEVAKADEKFYSNIQKMRNVAGAFVQRLIDTYPRRMEGAAVVIYADKAWI